MVFLEDSIFLNLVNGEREHQNPHSRKAGVNPLFPEKASVNHVFPEKAGVSLLFPEIKSVLSSESLKNDFSTFPRSLHFFSQNLKALGP